MKKYRTIQVNKQHAQTLLQQIPVPANLDQCLENSWQKGKQMRQQPIHLYRHRPAYGKRIAVAAASLCLLFGITVNLVPSAAIAMQEVPILGDIVKVITFQRFTDQDQYSDIDIKVPGVSGTGQEKLLKPKLQKKTYSFFLII